jgi:type I restriction enzyme, S subunit
MTEKNEIQQLPKNWKLVKLADVCEKILGGGTPSTKIENYWNGDIPWISSADIIGIKEMNPHRKITIEAVRNSTTNILPKGGIVVVTRVGLGKLAIAPYDICFSQDSQGLILNEKLINQSYALIYLSKAVQKFKQESRGTTISGVTKKQLTELQISLPPLPTQRLIVSKIEELFSELDKGIENLRMAQQQIKTYRQSVLKWAFEGRLTNENVKDGELPEGWKRVEVKEVAETYGGYAFKSSEFKEEGKYQVLRMGNVRPGILRYDESPVYMNIVDEKVLSRSLLQINDVIITQTGTRKKRDYGFTVLIPKSNLLLNQRIAAIRFKEKYIPKFFLYFSWTDMFKDQFFANETGNVGQGNVGMKAVTETLVPYCSVEEQQNIVQEIESRLSVADKMEESINYCLQKSDALTQSILKKAFEGKLVND